MTKIDNNTLIPCKPYVEPEKLKTPDPRKKKVLKAKRIRDKRARLDLLNNSWDALA